MLFTSWKVTGTRYSAVVDTRQKAPHYQSEGRFDVYHQLSNNAYQ
jgi:hypothetical protein